MRRLMLKSKIHRATVTASALHYMGSITIDRNLMEAVDLLPFEQVHVLNLDNGARVETYVIAGAKGSGQIQVNGAAARFFSRHDRIIILAYAQVEESELARLHPRVAFVDAKNRLTRVKIANLRAFLPRPAATPRTPRGTHG